MPSGSSRGVRIQLASEMQAAFLLRPGELLRVVAVVGLLHHCSSCRKAAAAHHHQRAEQEFLPRGSGARVGPKRLGLAQP